MEWVKQGEGTPESPLTWTRDEWKIEKHPFTSKYAVTRNGGLAGIATTLTAAQRAAPQSYDEFTVAFGLSLPFDGDEHYTVEDVEEAVLDALRAKKLTPVGLDILPGSAQLTVTGDRRDFE
jgi:hypothetical protein